MVGSRMEDGDDLSGALSTYRIVHWTILPVAALLEAEPRWARGWKPGHAEA